MSLQSKQKSTKQKSTVRYTEKMLDDDKLFPMQ